MPINNLIEPRNMFVIKNISDKQASYLTTLNVSQNNDIQVNLLDISYLLKENGLYYLYVSVGITNNQEITEIMKIQFEKNLLLMNLSYQIKPAIIIDFTKIITNISGIWRRFITQAFENEIKLELFINSVGTKNDPADQTIVLLPENPFDYNRLFALILNTNYDTFDATSQINVYNIECLVKDQYN